ncbi:MAG TPA: hypothetical protein VHP11_03370 [Tepidisphaeraceae bacterium]|nr:hypothetical protein [Tepidisphaeraceae bacterium]
MKQRLLSLWCGLMTLLAVPALAMAADEDAAPASLARFEGFTRSVKVDPSSPALLWGVLILLALVCMAVLFKDAKRSHMD